MNTVTSHAPSHATDPVLAVLIVEDEIMLSRMLEELLKHFGIDIVIAASNIATARTYIEKVKFDLIFCDNRLPDGLGINFLDHMKLEHPETFRCLMSGDFRPTSQQAADHNFLQKPLGADDIRHILKMALKAKSQA